MHGSRVPENCTVLASESHNLSRREAGPAKWQDTGSLGHDPGAGAQAAAGGGSCSGGGSRPHAGAGPRWKGRGLRGRAAAQGGLWWPSVTHAAAREAAAAVAAGAAGTGRSARAPPGAGRLSIARLLSDPRRGRACPGVLEKPSAGRGSHGAGARSAGGRARCGRERRGAPGLPLFEAGDPMRRAREGREIRSSGGEQRGWRTVRQRPEPGGGQQEAAAART